MKNSKKGTLSEKYQYLNENIITFDANSHHFTEKNYLRARKTAPESLGPRLICTTAGWPFFFFFVYHSNIHFILI